MPFHEWLLPRYHLSIAPHRIPLFAAFWGTALLLPRRLPKDPAYCSILWSRLGTISAPTRTGSRALQPYLFTLRQRLGITSQTDPKFRNILCSCFGTASAPPPTASYVLQPSVVLPRYAFGTTSAPSRLSTASYRIPCFGTSLVPLLYCVGTACHRIQHFATICGPALAHSGNASILNPARSLILQQPHFLRALSIAAERPLPQLRLSTDFRAASLRHRTTSC